MKILIKSLFALSVLCFCHTIAADVKTVENAIKINKEKAKLPYYWLIRLDHVKADQRIDYEQKISLILNKLKGRPYFTKVITLHNPLNSVYCYLFPLIDMREWTGINYNWQKESSRENIRKMIDSYSIIFTQSLAFFSEVPSTGSLSSKNPNYVRMDQIQLHPGAESRFKELVKEWGARIRKDAPSCGWFFHEILMGENLPAYLLFSGDCITASDQGITFEKFLIEKEAMKSIVKEIKKYNSDYVPQLSTTPFVYQGK